MCRGPEGRLLLSAEQYQRNWQVEKIIASLSAKSLKSNLYERIKKDANNLHAHEHVVLSTNYK